MRWNTHTHTHAHTHTHICWQNQHRSVCVNVKNIRSPFYNAHTLFTGTPKYPISRCHVSSTLISLQFSLGQLSVVSKRSWRPTVGAQPGLLEFLPVLLPSTQFQYWSDRQWLSLVLSRQVDDCCLSLHLSRRWSNLRDVFCIISRGF